MDLTELSKKLEHFITPQWAIEAILEREILTHRIIDPCTGTGVLAAAARARGHSVLPIDIHDWGYAGTHIADFLQMQQDDIFTEFSALLNPPFSKAKEFVNKCLDLGARKVVCFQRFSWWESADRRGFWDDRPPSRVYVCGARADCWRYDLPINERGKRYDAKTGKEMSSTPTAHAWFVWDRGHTGGTMLDRLYKDKP